MRATGRAALVYLNTKLWCSSVAIHIDMFVVWPYILTGQGGNTSHSIYTRGPLSQQFPPHYDLYAHSVTLEHGVQSERRRCSILTWVSIIDDQYIKSIDYFNVFGRHTLTLQLNLWEVLTSAAFWTSRGRRAFPSIKKSSASHDPAFLFLVINKRPVVYRVCNKLFVFVYSSVSAPVGAVATTAAAAAAAAASVLGSSFPAAWGREVPLVVPSRAAYDFSSNDQRVAFPVRDLRLACSVLCVFRIRLRMRRRCFAPGSFVPKDAEISSRPILEDQVMRHETERRSIW